MIKYILVILPLFSLLMFSQYKPNPCKSVKQSSTEIVQDLVSILSGVSRSVWIQKSDKALEQTIDIDSFNIKMQQEDAGLIIAKSESKQLVKATNTPILVLEYDLLKKYDNAVAAFYWKKGRPNIVFLKQRMKKFNIILPLSYTRYQEDTIW